MRKQLLLLLILFALIGCRSPELTPTSLPPATETAVPPPPSATSTVPPPTATAVPPTTTPQPPILTPTPAYPRYDGPPIPRQAIGIQMHIHREDQAALFAHLRALNAGWVKVQVSWKLYQPYPERYATDRFAELDELVRRAGENGIAVLLSVSKAPEWSRPTTEMDGPPSDFTLYRDFMAYLAERYRSRVAAYELWNEPNLQREWNGVPLSAMELSRLVAHGAEGARAADPDAILISAPPATTGINDGVTAIDDRVFLRQMLASGVLQSVDAIGAHPYGWANPPGSTVAEPDTAVPSHNNHPSFFFLDTLNDYTALLAEFGATNTPIWVTEFGWGTFQGIDAAPPAGAEFMNHVSEWQQAVYIMDAYHIAHQIPQVGPMILWNLNFGPLLGGAYSVSGYSILRPDGSLRPAYKTMQQLTKNN